MLGDAIFREATSASARLPQHPVRPPMSALAPPVMQIRSARLSACEEFMDRFGRGFRKGPLARSGLSQPNIDDRAADVFPGEQLLRFVRQLGKTDRFTNRSKRFQFPVPGQ